VRRLVQQFAPTVCSAFYDDYHLPAYTYDKTSCGLIDAYRFAGLSRLLPFTRRLPKRWCRIFPRRRSRARSNTPARTRTRPIAGMKPIPCRRIYSSLTVSPATLATANSPPVSLRTIFTSIHFPARKRFARRTRLQPRECLQLRHAGLSGAGNPKHLRAARNGFDFLRSTQSFATGGWGPDELFRVPGSGEIGASLSKSHASFETPCGAYGHFKIVRYLLAVTGNSRYGDSMESVLYNTILGAKPLKEDGTSFLLFRLQHARAQELSSRQVALLLGNLSADHGRLRHQLLPSPRRRRRLREPLCSLTLTWRQHGANLSLTQRTEYTSTARTPSWS